GGAGGSVDGAPAVRRALVAAVAGAALFAALAAAHRRLDWLGLARALPATSALALGPLLPACLRRRSAPAELARRAPVPPFAARSLGLLAKLGLAARFDHYGFALAMPATLLLVAALVGGLPRLARGGGGVARALAAAAVAAAIAAVVAESERRYAAE